MGQSTQAGSNRLSASVSTAVERLEQAASTAASAMQGAAAEVVQETGNVSTQLVGQIQQLLAQQVQQVHTTKGAYETLGQATEQLRVLLKDAGEAFGQLRPLTSDLAAITRDLRSTGDTARNAHIELHKVSDSFAQQGTLLQQTVDRHVAFLNQFQDVFKIVEQGLGSILRQIGEGIQQYQNALKESLSKRLQEFDNHLATATQQIKMSIEGIGPGLEDLSEAIDSAAKQIGNNGRGK